MGDAQGPNVPPAQSAPPGPPAAGTPQPPPGGSGLSAEAQGLLEFVREENEANREYLTTLVRWVGGAIGLLALIAGFFGWRSIQDLKDQLRNEAQAQVQKATENEIGQMQGEIRSRLDKEFSDPAIKKSIHDAAAAAVTPAVTAEVGSTFSFLRSEADATRSDVDKYAMPRRLTDKQRKDLIDYLSKHKPHYASLPGAAAVPAPASVTIYYTVNDPEGKNYAEQLAEAFRAARWDAPVAADPVPLDSPAGIAVVYGTDIGTASDAEDQVLLICADALRASRIADVNPIRVDGRPTHGPFGAFIYVGARPLALPPSQR